jgi:exodeoxyribonuclease V beta subunit
VTAPPRRFELHDAPLCSGTVLLEASAGTGKTYTITGVLLRMLLEDVVEHVEQALVVTFTVAAADELKNRLRAGIRRALQACSAGSDPDPFFQGLARHGPAGVERLQRALDEFDQASVMTIHGFCKRLLEEAAFESDQPFELDFAADDGALLDAAAADALRSAREHDGPMFGALMEHAQLTPGSVAALYRKWRRFPDTDIEPDPPRFAQRLAELGAAVRDAAAKWDAGVVDVLEDVKWKKDKAPFKGDPGRYVDQQARLLDSRPELCLSFLTTCALSNLRERAFKKDLQKLQHPWFERCDDVRAALAVATQHLQVDLLLRVDARFTAIKQQQAVCTFDDLLQKAHDAVCAGPRRGALLDALRRRYRVGLIDEFQDTDARQYGLLAETFSERPLFLVGDPKQSIYGFRGADLRTYLRAAADAADRATLDTNYRSSRALVEAVNLLFERADAFVEPAVTMHPAAPHDGAEALALGDPEDGTLDSAALRVRALPFELDHKGKPKVHNADAARNMVAADVADEITRLLGGGVTIDDAQLQPRHVAVLTRSNKEAVLVQEHLRERGVVAVIGRAGDVFETEELLELERLLDAILTPNDLLRARAALTTRLWGLDGPTIAALDRDPRRAEDALSLLDDWRKKWVHQGFAAMVEQLFTKLGVEARWLARSGGERRLTNLRQLCEMLHEAEHERRLSPEGLLEWLRHERAHKDQLDSQRRELRLESDEDAVQIRTMHGSKGLEYEVVFCPFLWAGRNAELTEVSLPRADDARRRFAFRVDKDDAGWRQLEEDRLAEDVRLAYVALTRAKRRCYVHWGPLRGYHYSPLAWLLDPAQERRGPGWQVAWGEAFRDSAASMFEDADAVAARSGGAMCVERLSSLHAPGAAQSAQPPASVPAGQTRKKPRRSALAMHSFSSLVRGSEPGEHAHDVRDPSAPDAATGDGIFGFARGADAGQCLHDVLERVDLDALTSDATRDVVARTLAKHGLADPGRHPGAIDPVEAVLQNLSDLAAARTHAGGPTLSELCRGDKLVEWKFTLPMGLPAVGVLAAQFDQHGGDVAKAYAPRLRQLRPKQLRGYLTGFADLVARHEGRYWVVDWKSNHLGGCVADYGPAALAGSMEHHDYILQYHLYVLAWHRHLQARVRSYDYDEHFGGVCYAFLRAAQPGRSDGMFHDRPQRALVEGLDRWAKGEA